MRTPSLTALALITAVGPAWAQDETTETPAEVMEEMAETEADEVIEEMSDGDAAGNDAGNAESQQAEQQTDLETSDAAQAENPTLEEIAASDPALDVRTNEEGEVDAMVMLSDVLFSFGDATLEPAAIEVLSGIAEKLDGVDALEITGHTDAVGDEDFNLALGQRRADAVRDWLVANGGLSEDVVTARGVGEAEPVAPNLNDDGSDNPDGRALNRRVEFTLADEG